MKQKPLYTWYPCVSLSFTFNIFISPQALSCFTRRHITTASESEKERREEKEKMERKERKEERRKEEREEKREKKGERKGKKRKEKKKNIGGLQDNIFYVIYGVFSKKLNF